jgi:hypothetical protein
MTYRLRMIPAVVVVVAALTGTAAAQQGQMAAADLQRADVRWRRVVPVWADQRRVEDRLVYQYAARQGGALRLKP